MPEFTREQLREFNKKGYTSVAARFARSAEEMLIELERKLDEMTERHTRFYSRELTE